MESNHSPYVFADSISRMDSILGASDLTYEDANSIPSRTKLTFDNGFNVNCVAMFVDLRDSSKLPTRYTKPALAKIYRAYVSETVALVNGNAKCAEVNIIGDCVSAILDAHTKPDIDEAFATAARVRSLIDALNCRLKRHRIDPVRVGVGLSYGRALMIKAGRKGSSINDVVWMGTVVNEASKLCAKASKALPQSGQLSHGIMLSKGVFINLNADNQKLCLEVERDAVWGATVVNTEMNKWITANCP